MTSKQTQEEIAEERATMTLQTDLRELTANLIRITAGAGKPELIQWQAKEVVVAIGKLVELGAPPLDEEVRDMLNVERDYGPNREARRERAIDKMMRGGLRRAAGELAQQGVQRSNGEDMIFEGMRTIEHIQAEGAAARKAEDAKARKPRKTATKRATASPKKLA